jgi:hypothetical protein
MIAALDTTKPEVTARLKPEFPVPGVSVWAETAGVGRQSVEKKTLF